MNKIFEDSVHGQISIPENYVREIIDTRLFQRLKRIEQTSMRPLFPSAHHDRFIHSIGVYHIGKILFASIQNNTKQEEKDIYNFIEGDLNNINCLFVKQKDKNADYWAVLKNTYELACLLHDCGHAPFSHAFETYYYNEKKGEANVLDIPLNQDIINEYSAIINNTTALGKSEKAKAIDEFKSDLKNSKPSPHELVSAWLVLHNEGFRKQIKNLKACPLLAARMIIGCTFQDKTPSKMILNCFIGILNGHAIDADRIDYTIRDNWATGLTPTTINIGRLFSSVFIANKSESTSPDYVVCFKKQGFSELQCLVDEKNYTSYWIFNHHKIKYIEELFNKSVKRLAILFNNRVQEYRDTSDEQKRYTIENESMYSLLDYHNLIKPQPFCIEVNEKETYKEYLYLISDDDIIYLLKKYFLIDNNAAMQPIKDFLCKNKTYIDEWFSRTQQLVPLWKTHFEYYGQFYKIFIDKSGEIADQIQQKKLLDNEFVESILFESAVETIKKIKDEEYILSTDKPKKIHAKSEIKNIEPKSIYVKIHNDYPCYSELNLPTKNSGKKTYEYPYIFMPKIKNKDGSITDEEIRNKYYINFYKETISQKCDKYIKDNEICNL